MNFFLSLSRNMESVCPSEMTAEVSSGSESHVILFENVSDLFPYDNFFSTNLQTDC